MYKTKQNHSDYHVDLSTTYSLVAMDLMPELFKMAKLYANIYGEEGFYFEQFLNGGK